ncbi:MAG: DNA polymerase III subunit delta, partial [Eggerthellaceae bacterium]|nr:DNA polymerase III subunit delta [Eggerthellaceae bacterium]
MSDAFDHIYGQPKVRTFLRAIFEQDLLTHAYLFTGHAGSNKTEAAYAFAQT